MKPAEVLTYALLAGEVTLNKQLKDNSGKLTDFYIVQLTVRGSSIGFQYHKDGDELTFVKGSKRESDPTLGTTLSTIYGFDHLLKTLSL